MPSGEAAIIQFPVGRERDEQPIGFYTTAQAARVSRVPRYMLYAWKREGIIIPRIVSIDIEGHEDTGYSFDAVIYLRLLRMLREVPHPLERAVKALDSLRTRFGPPGPAWADVRFFAQHGDLFVERADEGEVTVATRHGQKVASELFGPEFAQLRERADALLVPQRFASRVMIDPSIRLGQPVLRDTTIETRLLYDIRWADTSYDRIRQYYPMLSPAQIRAAIRFESFLDAEAA